MPPVGADTVYFLVLLMMGVVRSLAFANGMLMAMMKAMALKELVWFGLLFYVSTVFGPRRRNVWKRPNKIICVNYSHAS